MLEITCEILSHIFNNEDVYNMLPEVVCLNLIRFAHSPRHEFLSMFLVLDHTSPNKKPLIELFAHN